MFSFELESLLVTFLTYLVSSALSRSGPVPRTWLHPVSPELRAELMKQGVFSSQEQNYWAPLGDRENVNPVQKKKKKNSTPPPASILTKEETYKLTQTPCIVNILSLHRLEQWQSLLGKIPGILPGKSAKVFLGRGILCMEALFLRLDSREQSSSHVSFMFTLVGLAVGFFFTYYQPALSRAPSAPSLNNDQSC